MEFLKLIMENFGDIVNALMGIASGIMAIALLIPGEQPEKFIKNKILPLLEKFSKK